MKISVITVSYNSEKYIRRMIHSVNVQKYPNIEHIFIDALSEDATVSIINSESKRSPFIVSEADSGLYDAMNKGIKMASGDYITFLNSDDYYLCPSVISNVALYLKNNHDVVFSNVQYVDCLGNNTRLYKSKGFKPWMFSFGFMPAHPGSFVKASIVKKIGFFDTRFTIAADFDYFSRVFLLPDLKYSCINQVFVMMQEGGVSSRNIKSNLIITREMSQSLKKNKYFSSYILLLIRLPVKFFISILKNWSIQIKSKSSP